MTGESTNKLRDRLHSLEENAREGVAFVDNITFVASRLNAADGHDETNTTVKTGSGLSFVEIRLEAFFNSVEDVPMDVVNDRDWDTCSVSQHNRGARVYLKERKDLSA